MYKKIAGILVAVLSFLSSFSQPLSTAGVLTNNDFAITYSNSVGYVNYSALPLDFHLPSRFTVDYQGKNFSPVSELLRRGHTYHRWITNPTLGATYENRENRVWQWNGCYEPWISGPPAWFDKEIPWTYDFSPNGPMRGSSRVAYFFNPTGAGGYPDTYWGLYTPPGVMDNNTSSNLLNHAFVMTDMEYAQQWYPSKIISEVYNSFLWGGPGSAGKDYSWTASYINPTEYAWAMSSQENFLKFFNRYMIKYYYYVFKDYKDFCYSHNMTPGKIAEWGFVPISWYVSGITSHYSSWNSVSTDINQLDYTFRDTTHSASTFGNYMTDEMDYMNVSIYPLYGERNYVHYGLVFYTEANAHWWHQKYPNKPLLTCIWSQYMDANTGASHSFVGADVGEAQAIWPIMAGADGITLWDEPSGNTSGTISSSTPGEAMESFVKGLYRLSNHNAILSNNKTDVRYIKPTTDIIADLTLNKPLWRGIVNVSNDSILIAVQDLFNYGVKNVTISYTDPTGLYQPFNDVVELHGAEIFLGAAKLTRAASPNLQLSITQDNFVPNGASPYTTSTREITIQNTGSATAQNISLQLGLSPYYSYSAMQLANVQVLNASNVAIAGATVTGTTWTGSNDPTGFPCGGTSSNYKSTIQVSIPSLAIGAIAKVRVTADHCMANFEHTTTSYYTWNYWGAEAAYQDGIGMSYSTARLNNNAAQALDNYVWTAYQAPYTPPVVTSGSNLFTVELGSGTYGNPSNNQNRGSSYPYSRARVDLVLPGNVVFNTGSLSDIVGEYSVDGTANQLATVTASSIQWGPTLSNGDQTYYILFPPSQYLPIRRIFLSLRVMSYPVGVHDISARIRTTFDYHYATDTYGWLPASPNYSYRTQSGAFPVDLLSFTGEIFNENAELSWITGSESNNAGFEVEKSLNGNDFEKIAFVEGAGTTSSAQNYNFTDYNFSSRAWYRLNQVDYDGKATPSNIVELSSESLLATISPNPLENGIATISLPAGENRKITVYNALGEKVLETSVDTNLYTLNLSTQSEGIYSVVCLVDGKKQVLKVKK